MGWVIKNTQRHLVSGFDDDDEVQFTQDFNCAWWWESEEDANWFIGENGVGGVAAEDTGGSNPPGPGQPGKP